MGNRGTTQPTAPVEPLHAGICILFELGGDAYEAVSFLKAGETMVSGDEMLRRTNSDGRVVGQEEWESIWKHRAGLPMKLRRFYLATKRPGPHHRRGISCLYWGKGGWCEYWLDLEGSWLDRDLVLRRRV